MFDLGRNTTTLSKFIGCIDLIDFHQISPKHPRNNDKGKCVRKFWYLKYLSHGVHLHNVSHIFFSYSNLRCRYLLNQSEYRKSLTHTCWSIPCEWDCAAILLMQQHPMPEKFNRRTLGHFMPYWLLTSDQDRISPYNMNTISSMQVMRIEMNINHGIISWSNTKFSELTS